ncbi:hypothetical protein ABZ837_19140 [Streptomyces sp. NPDC047197]|uniref:hypothetical protein n=1 Tax=Streptomyces sp. NPDC047197 TaxID=3155477 RepID=UPI0033CFA930
MAGVSRRALLGYSGSAAAGAVIASAGSAEAAEGKTAEGKAAGASTASDVEWGSGVEFSGNSSIGDVDASMRVKFSLEIENAPSGKDVTELDVANAINGLLESRGWPPMQFYGTVSAPLN